MIEVIGALFRWLQLASNMILIGGCVFLAIAVRAKTAFDAPWLARLNRALPWLSVTLLLGLVGLLATTTAQATGVAENAWRPGAWLELLQKTRIGLIWTVRAALALARVRNGSLHSVLTLGALAVCAVRDRRGTHAGCWDRSQAIPQLMNCP